ncbi:MAG TPA: hypothetical protein VK735_26365 [Pseudonocardia sp.]|uniref:hypothetical protein n=1 Tax=Pseudonocardia sp. TaxID=60912 RepID=UPI002D0C981D|nr:hypothetical protein [Pseudonocardia sp.]HTF50984.1 hypothetical protein [Pseudonocardia sp.]
MRSFRRIAVITISGLLLVAGVVLGFLPVKATLTEIAPELRLITVPCGNVYLRNIPPTQPGDLVALPGEQGVYLPRASYVEHCSEAVGWRRYAAWGLTALGALGLAITFSAARTPVGPGGPRPSRRSPGSSDGAGRSEGSDGGSGGGSDGTDSPASSDGRDTADGPGAGPSGGPGGPAEPGGPGGPGEDSSASGDTDSTQPLRGRHARRN